MSGTDNANHELFDYYANEGKDPKSALKLAELEIKRRQDVYTRNIYAWALYLNGQFSEAPETNGLGAIHRNKEYQILLPCRNDFTEIERFVFSPRVLQASCTAKSKIRMVSGLL